MCLVVRDGPRLDKKCREMCAGRTIDHCQTEGREPRRDPADRVSEPVKESKLGRYERGNPRTQEFFLLFSHGFPRQP